MHPLIAQLRFTREEFLRGLEGLSAEDAARRLPPMNSIAWMVGHLAWHEQMLWLERPQERTVAPEVKVCGFGKAAANPPFDAMLAGWRAIVAAADPYIDALTGEKLLAPHPRDPRPEPETTGTSLRRLTYHYWFHLGESQAVRQMLGHTGLPSFVGNINRAPYVPEPRG
jgi:hypothetical protein